MKYLVILTLLLSFGCMKKKFREGKFFAGEKYVSAETLNLGHTTYMEYCFACHGVDGDGEGVAAKGVYPPVRNFKQGLFKFGIVKDGALPHDEDMLNIIKKGLTGSAMLPWDISDQRADAVWQYIKTFAPEIWEGKEKKLGEVVTLAKDPFGIARRSAAIEKGREVYHFTAQCTTCHRGYIDLNSYNSMAKKLGEDKVSELESDYFQLKAQDSEYGSQMIPPDFTWHPIRSGNTVEEIAYRIAAGVGGVMPTWKEVITDQEIWAVSYYVKSLQEDYKDKNERNNFVSRLEE